MLAADGSQNQRTSLISSKGLFMYATCRWLAVGLLVLTVGCNKSEPAGTGTGAAASVPAKAPTTVAADVAMNNLGKSIGQFDAAAIW
jgi:hypothetical protein